MICHWINQSNFTYRMFCYIRHAQNTQNLDVNLSLSDRDCVKAKTDRLLYNFISKVLLNSSWFTNEFTNEFPGRWSLTSQEGNSSRGRNTLTLNLRCHAAKFTEQRKSNLDRKSGVEPRRQLTDNTDKFLASAAVKTPSNIFPCNSLELIGTTERGLYSRLFW